MSVNEAIILAIVQGITEFLPVSSSGHLVLTSWLLGVAKPTIAYDILIHFGTLLAIVAAFWPETKEVAAAAWVLVTRPRSFFRRRNTEASYRLLVNLIVGTIPAVAVALLFFDRITALFSEPYFAGAMLVVTGTVLFISQKVPAGRRRLYDTTAFDGIWIGIGQALATLPGISRSGTTISAGLGLGLDREAAARFSFLLAIPAILGSTVLALKDLAVGNVATDTWILLVGVVVSAVTGYAAIRVLLVILRRGRLIWFSYYTWTLGMTIIAVWWLQR